MLLPRKLKHRKQFRGKRDGDATRMTEFFPDHPVTARPPEVGMGGGKGPLDHFVATVKPGQIMFEMSGVSEEVAKEAMRLAAHKLPVGCRFVVKE
ncbi:MAG: large subunit ribosomal protein L16 [Candidatus Berkelbacteria bacterium Gr01-1014_85]|uniref:50S ribosomal protein L16 n=1 Tax=Candidatus Berkelbacteria bacterium Gr01-1014_85 TaxID=2017150 RepID=A0A554JD05_9BACT|nr:MAG: large subunit ribosomal protein L16 [Candidatus Berkelbacteria bacterium Gr01-1014_85]